MSFEERETAFSPESMVGASEARVNGNPFWASRERRKDGVLELATGRRLGGDGVPD